MRWSRRCRAFWRSIHRSASTNVRELIALAKAKPDQLFFGSVGVGSPPHLAGELFKVMAGVKLTHVPYAGGSGQAATDLIAGRISMVFSPASTIAPHIAAGSVKALAAATAKRAGLFPDLPTIAEAGLPGFDSGIWGGLMAPAGTPRPVIDRLARAANDALKTPEVQSGVAQCRHRSARRHARGFRQH